MKLILSILFVFTAQHSYAANWYCSADCGTVTHVLSFVYEGLVPAYSGQVVMGEGTSIVRAYQNMKSNCSQILHDGFKSYTINFIQLNTNVRPEKVCQQTD